MVVVDGSGEQAIRKERAAEGQTSRAGGHAERRSAGAAEQTRGDEEERRGGHNLPKKCSAIASEFRHGDEPKESSHYQRDCEGAKSRNNDSPPYLCRIFVGGIGCGHAI
eukprot:scaffold28518_cov131-Isochrysis_galbana.AAC.2